MSSWSISGRLGYWWWTGISIVNHSKYDSNFPTHQELTFPENVALPIGGPGTDRYLVIEIHYNNPGKVSGNL